MSGKTRHIYAMFEDRTTALLAYDEIHQQGCQDGHCSVLMPKQGFDPEDLTMGETAAKEGAKTGAVTVGVATAILAGLIVLPGGLLGVGPLALAMVGGGFGAAVGGLLGAVSGSIDPDHAFRQIEDDIASGKVLITVETDDEGLERMCNRVFASHGGVRIS